ncbi:hypothetical protein [Singulisphaera sp. PoT]|uniref:hypothetical protein n=1 Tax=Singulisphaera sp. PoT TaxID=3411797 RepID=UPI003BF55FDF
MRRTILRLTICLACAGALSGCASQPDARYVYQDGEFGVIGIPRNTMYGNKDFLKQAHEMMSKHFPDGYEIVRAEEVVEGERVLDKGRKTEFQTEPTLSALNQMIKLGKLDQVTSLQQKDQIPILESRIIYKRKSADTPQGANGFSAMASVTPRFYIDPNETARCHANQTIADARKGIHPGKDDAMAAKKASADAPKDDGSAVKKASLDSNTTPANPPK